MQRSRPSTACFKLGYFGYINPSQRSSNAKTGHRSTNVINFAKLDRNNLACDNEGVTVLVQAMDVYEAAAIYLLHSHLLQLNQGKRFLAHESLLSYTLLDVSCQ